MVGLLVGIRLLKLSMKRSRNEANFELGLYFGGILNPRVISTVSLVLSLQVSCYLFLVVKSVDRDS